MGAVASGFMRDGNGALFTARMAGHGAAGITPFGPYTVIAPHFIQAAFTQLVRPGNVTPYGAGESISNHGTAGSVVALVSAPLSVANDDPVRLQELLVVTSDTGLAGKRLRAILYNSDPTASSGVGAGDNAAFANKHAGYVGSMTGTLEAGFSDGAVGRLIPTFNASNDPQAGAFILAKPASGAKTFWIQYQAVDTFTPSANSTTIDAAIRAFQVFG